ncbi:sugar phosphate isomerase/epimerase family protein [Desulfonatronovibrio hydrogenovorans]|uniref:sugar phosphate isomerase/epimerase family protein n=1 Tax=Desulfonatronovibrio hydrogenovorans TaxID=53245 RepID=UPI0006897D88|nr:sugar phosphate isomerase/epimerase family protein [Desulfonatronovibrio hydrogenovorans]
MTGFFVNLPLTYFDKFPEYSEYFLESRICPELGLDADCIDSWEKQDNSKRLDFFKSKDLRVAFHLPFLDLKPGSLDSFICGASARRLVMAAEQAARYSPDHMIVHSGYQPGVYDDDYSRWLDNSVSTWEKVLDAAGDVPVYLENVHEQDPTHIKDVLTELGGRMGFCLDLGHWFSFGRGKKDQDLNIWLQTLAPYLKHLHLHDNDGSFDQHLGMGAGEIPFVELFAGLEFMDISPTFTLEPHTTQDFFQSLDFMISHQYWFTLLGLKKKDFENLKGMPGLG